MPVRPLSLPRSFLEFRQQMSHSCVRRPLAPTAKFTPRRWRNIAISLTIRVLSRKAGSRQLRVSCVQYYGGGIEQSTMYRILTKSLWFLIHFFIGAIGVPIAAAVLAYSVLLPLHEFFPSIGERTVHWILTETPYFPLQILVGFLWGFLISRRYRHVAMLWTWAVPALAISLALLFAPLRHVIVSGVEITKVE